LRSAVLAGDERAWQALYDDSYDALAVYVSWRCAGLSDFSEEIIQDTWLTAVRRIRAFDPERGNFIGWLRGIAANLVRNRLRQRRIHRDIGKGAENGGYSPAPDAALQKKEEAEQLVRALAELPEHYEGVLRAKYLDRAEVADIAAMWQQTPKAIESLLTRARQALRETYVRLEKQT
jgi:RNA polymerase sigma-70 factor (ECF subfamily)